MILQISPGEWVYDVCARGGYIIGRTHRDGSSTAILDFYLFKELKSYCGLTYVTVIRRSGFTLVVFKWGLVATMFHEISLPQRDMILHWDKVINDNISAGRVFLRRVTGSLPPGLEKDIFEYFGSWPLAERNS